MVWKYPRIFFSPFSSFFLRGREGEGEGKGTGLEARMRLGGVCVGGGRG